MQCSYYCIFSQLTPACSHLCCDRQHQWEAYISATPEERDVWCVGCSPCTLNRQRGTTPSFFFPPDVPADERIWPFKSGGGWAKIHDGLITLSVVKLKLYIQSIGFMMPLQYLIEIKCQNAWWPWASSDGNQAVDDSNLDPPLSVYKTFIWYYSSVYW